MQIYTLELEDGKWYVGKSDDAVKRYQQHKGGDGSAWTKLHKPVRIYEIIVGDDFDEDKITKKLMAEHGIDNVRGGSYIKPTLTLGQKSYYRTK